MQSFNDSVLDGYNCVFRDTFRLSDNCYYISFCFLNTYSHSMGKNKINCNTKQCMNHRGGILVTRVTLYLAKDVNVSNLMFGFKLE